jgi:hypothetical protein
MSSEELFIPSVAAKNTDTMTSAEVLPVQDSEMNSVADHINERRMASVLPDLPLDINIPILSSPVSKKYDM